MHGAILCGGASRRMGRDKALVPWEGIPMVARVAMALHGARCESVTAIGGPADALAALGLDSVPDRWPGEGPMGGIITALRHLDGALVIVSCDLPLLQPGTIEVLMSALDDAVDAVVPSTDRPQPLCAVWGRSALGVLELAFDRGERSLRRVLPELRIAAPEVPAAELTNINTPGDLR